MSEKIKITVKRYKNVVYGRVAKLSIEEFGFHDIYKLLAESKDENFKIITGSSHTSLLYNKLMINPNDIELAFCYSYPNDSVAKKFANYINECVETVNSDEEKDE